MARNNPYQFLLIPLFLLGYDLRAWADMSDKGKVVSMDWEKVAGSSGYEVEVVELENGAFIPQGIFKVPSTSWSGNFNPGKYQLRIRSYDGREVPGAWGDFIPFDVQVAAPNLQKPETGVSLNAESDETSPVYFEWSEVGGAATYEVTVFPENGAAPIVEIANSNRLTLSLPVAKDYRWQVVSRTKGQQTSGTPKVQFSFSLIGKKLATPKLEVPESEFINKISWEKSKKAVSYSYVLLRKNEKGGWNQIEKNPDFKSTVVSIDNKYRGGTYRIKVMAFAAKHLPSDTAMLDFPVFIGNRSPETLEIAKMRQAMERDRDRYFFATYLISHLSFQGDNRETGNQLSYDVLAGTGRLGYGFMPKGKWGFLSIVDYSGLNLNNSTYTFASAEVEAIWRTYLTLQTQLRLFSGIFVKEVPEAKAFVSTDVSVSNVVQAGPLIGAQLWTAFNSRWGVQSNLQVNMSMLKVKTPNGEDLISSPSYQLGVMGSLKLKESITGFAGLAYRVDSAIYKATPYKGGADPNFAVEGDVNTSKMTGLYLNLYLEWGI